MTIKTLDRYIVRTFLQALFMWFLVFMALRVVLDLFLQLDEFTEQKASASVLIGNVLSYYLYQSFLYFTEMGGVIIVAAAAFAVARMNHTNELTAMLASGVSLHRVVWPVILCAMLMGGLIILDREVFIPRFRDHLVLQPDEMGQQKVLQLRGLTDSQMTAWYSPKYLPEKETMLNAVLALRDDKLRYEGQISAKQMMEADFRDENKRGWLTYDGYIFKGTDENPWRQVQRTDRIYTLTGPEALCEYGRRKWEEDHERDFPEGVRVTEVPAVRIRVPEFDMVLRARKFLPEPPARVREGESVVHRVIAGRLEYPRFDFLGNDDRVLATIAADAAEWVEGPESERHWKLTNGLLFHESDLTGEEVELRQSGRWLEFLSNRELTRLLQLERAQAPGEVRLTKYVRFAEPLNVLVMLLLGLPFILSRERNIKASAVLCVGIVAAFFFFIYICRYMGLPNFLGAFLPVLIFGPISVIMLDSVKT